MKESRLINLINEAIVRVLSESNLSGTNYLYHFTQTSNAVSIMESGALFLSGNESGKNRGYPFFLSLTRSKMGNEGYSSHLNVRFTFNADKLRNINDVKIEPIDFFKAGFGGGVGYASDEREERLLSRNRILDVENAIERIDIYLGRRIDDKSIYDGFQEAIQKYMGKTFFYKDRKAYDNMSNDEAISWHYIEMAAKYQENDINVDGCHRGKYGPSYINLEINGFRNNNKYFRKDKKSKGDKSKGERLGRMIQLDRNAILGGYSPDNDNYQAYNP